MANDDIPTKNGNVNGCNLCFETEMFKAADNLRGNTQPSDLLQGRMKKYQAVNLARRRKEEAMVDIGRIAQTIKAEKQKGQVILGLLVTGLVAFGK